MNTEEKNAPGADAAAYFDRRAGEWDRHADRNDAVIGKIMDAALIRPDVRVLDIACGTGVLFPDYLKRGVLGITGVDLSAGMIREAGQKFSGRPEITLIRRDIMRVNFTGQYDCCMVYNALPHFADPEKLIRHLFYQIKPGGTLTVAHGMSREEINRNHMRHRECHARELIPAETLAGLFRPYFRVNQIISDERMYLVSGTARSLTEI
jgi:2-polyprenyl-3-methyl-5-hydroxy-6-metoxy-1,4-benzoquinol methylase